MNKKRLLQTGLLVLALGIAFQASTCYGSDGCEGDESWGCSGSYDPAYANFTEVPYDSSSNGSSLSGPPEGTYVAPVPSNWWDNDGGTLYYYVYTDPGNWTGSVISETCNSDGCSWNN